VNTTPFNHDGSLDIEGLRANLRWLLKRTAGKDFIFNPLGSTGEFYAMSDEECKAVIKTTVEEVTANCRSSPARADLALWKPLKCVSMPNRWALTAYR